MDNEEPGIYFWTRFPFLKISYESCENILQSKDLLEKEKIIKRRNGCDEMEISILGNEFRIDDF